MKKMTSKFTGMALVALMLLSLVFSGFAAGQETIQPSPLPYAEPPAGYIEVVDETDLLNQVNNASDDIKLILGDAFPDDLGTELAFDYSHGHDVTIDGNGRSIGNLVGKRHITLKQTGGTFRLQNILLDGAVASNGGGIQVSTGNMSLSNIIIQNTTQGMYYADANGTLTIDDATFYNNNATAFNGGALQLAGYVTITNSTFTENSNNWSGYRGGAIAVENAKEVLIDGCDFKGNLGSTSGGAISMHNANGNKVTIKNSWFEGNKTRFSSDWADGAAIIVYTSGSTALLIENNVFLNNTAQDDGGAMLLENLNGTTTVVNNTFVGNVALGEGTVDDYQSTKSSGGAIQVSNTTHVTLAHNTFYGNRAADNANGQRGGAIGMYATGSQDPSVELYNNLFVENTAGAGHSEYANVCGHVTDSSGNVGLDNGTPVDTSLVNAVAVFGSASPALLANGSAAQPTLPVVPGSAADNAGTTLPPSITVSTDARGYSRHSTAPDAGAVESAYVLYHANGGKWDLPAGFVYSGTEYYDPAQSPLEEYYLVGNHDTAQMAFDPGSWLVTPTDADFLGWAISSSAIAPDYVPSKALPVGDNVLYAVYGQPAAVTYTVVYAPGASDTTGSVPVDGTAYPDGSSVLVEGPGDLDREGYSFTGWRNSVDGELYQQGESFNIENNTTLTAEWSLITHTVTYDANGGSGSHSVNMASGNHTVKAPDSIGIARANHTFAGWNTKVDGMGTAYQPGAVLPVDGNVTLYAQWKALYTVTYNANGGSGGQSVAVQAQSNYTLGNPVDSGITRDGYIFTGWNTAKSGNGTAYQPGKTIVVNRNMTLYAQWKQDTTTTSVLPSTSKPVGSSSSETPASSSTPAATSSEPSAVVPPATTTTTTTSHAPLPISGSSSASSRSSSSSSSSVESSSTSTGSSSDPAPTSSTVPPSAPVSSPEAGPNLTVVDKGSLPLFGTGWREHWSLLNLILAIAGVLLTVLLLFIPAFSKKRRGVKTLSWRIIGAVTGVLLAVIFLLTQNLAAPMVFADIWSILMLLLFAVQVIGALFARRDATKDKTDDEQANLT